MTKVTVQMTKELSKALHGWKTQYRNNVEEAREEFLAKGGYSKEEIEEITSFSNDMFFMLARLAHLSTETSEDVEEVFLHQVGMIAKALVMCGEGIQDTSTQKAFLEWLDTQQFKLPDLPR